MARCVSGRVPVLRLERELLWGRVTDHRDGLGECLREQSPATCGPVAAGEPGLFYYGPDELGLPFGNGFRCVDGAPGRVFRVFPFVIADAAGSLKADLDLAALPGAITPGSTWRFQARFRDPAGGGQGFDLSDGVSIDFTP